MTVTTRRTVYLTVALLLAWTATGLAQAPAASPAASPAGPMQWVGAMVNMGGGGTTWVTLRADSFSSPATIQALKDILKDKGQDTVVNQLNAMPQIGWIRIGNLTGYPLPVIRYITTQTGYRIVAVCARPISFAGAVTQGIITTQYPIGVITLDVNTKGKSSGQVLPAVKVQFNEDGQFDPKVYGTAPLKLMQIREEAVQ